MLVISLLKMETQEKNKLLLLERGIKPEELPPEEDIKKLERRVSSEPKKIRKNP